LTVYYYYVNADDLLYGQWTSRNGDSPYLNAIDYPNNYIYNIAGLPARKEGVYDFQNHGAESAEAITKVELEVYTLGVEDPDTGMPTLSGYIWNGAAYSAIASQLAPDVWGWLTWDITATIGTWAKVDSMRCYLLTTCGGASAEIWADCMRLKVTTATVATVMLARLKVGVGL